jgi:CHAD domain-containing protein
MKLVSKYYKKRKETIKSIIDKTPRKYYPGTFHKLRVEIKKLNALLELLDLCSKNFKHKKTFKPFKELFDQAGKVRELQVEEAILKSYKTNSLKDFKNELRENRISEKKKYFKFSTSKVHTLLNSKFNIIQSFLSDIDNKRANKFINRKKKEISKLLKQRSSRTRQLHELRKQLKILNYIRKHISEERSKFTNKKDTLSTLLGKWHDCEIILEHFEKALKHKGVNSKTKSKLRDIKAIIKAEFNKLYTRINKTIKQTEFYKS